nr:hypothetical protein [Tanacetum cinerariifolium]
MCIVLNLNDLDIATINIDGQSTKFEALPPIIPVDDDVDFVDDEDDVPYDLAYYDNEFLAIFDDDDDNEVANVVYSSDEEE